MYTLAIANFLMYFSKGRTSLVTHEVEAANLF